LIRAVGLRVETSSAMDFLRLKADLPRVSLLDVRLQV
jgi:hypothetical protein